MSSFIFRKPPDWNDLHFSKKIQHYQIQLDKPHSYYVDKLIAKKIVKDVCGDKIEVPKTIRILKDYEDVMLSDINPKYMIKASHGSSWNMNFENDIVYDINEVKLKLSSWNCLFGDNVEKQYSYLEYPVYRDLCRRLHHKLDDKFYSRVENQLENKN
jgi:hypothetical protein